ncbi:hypothetical protein L917_03595 [Phytophthora nicotianae]|uniref:Uncharacterized protein n=2 Tax=Phytophthora nicotianae TaxID=4792 RepID=W2QM42_PHYN3|nr:hypothetical protein PPTG_22291 [Phytophthora nicotianae INRA-310]ETK93013.1 hypothetical protein L915_03732 [Phytophthora nicotianae]ETL99570.1 hypothetical protein L917_03595 [Phytophthora nicotianae]ETN14006.1 hypothetical protein PPTG_22291 [Phytophthora nicotianae INRA-310]
MIKFVAAPHFNVSAMMFAVDVLSPPIHKKPMSASSWAAGSSDKSKREL